MGGRKRVTARIQETHLDSSDMGGISNYNIYFSYKRKLEKGTELNKNPKGGVAIAIRKSIAKNIYQINEAPLFWGPE